MKILHAAALLCYNDRQNQFTVEATNRKAGEIYGNDK